MVRKHQTGRGQFKAGSEYVEGGNLRNQSQAKPRVRGVQNWGEVGVREQHPGLGVAGQAGAEITLWDVKPTPATSPRVWQLTSSASAMVMSTAQPAMPARPMRCRVRRPARSTTNSYGKRECQCQPHLELLPPPPNQRLAPRAGKATWHYRDQGVDGTASS